LQAAFNWAHNTGKPLVLDNTITVRQNVIYGDLHLIDGGGMIDIQLDDSFSVLATAGGWGGNVGAVILPRCAPGQTITGSADPVGTTYLVKVEKGVRLNMVKDTALAGRPTYPWRFVGLRKGSFVYLEEEVVGEASIGVGDINNSDFYFFNQVTIGGHFKLTCPLKTTAGGLWIRQLGRVNGVNYGKEYESNITIDVLEVEKHGGTDEAIAIFAATGNSPGFMHVTGNTVRASTTNGFAFSVLNNQHLGQEDFSVNLGVVHATCGGDFKGARAGLKSNNPVAKLWDTGVHIGALHVTLIEVESPGSTNIFGVETIRGIQGRTNTAGYAPGVNQITLDAYGSGRFNIGDKFFVTGDDTEYTITNLPTNPLSVSSGGVVTFTPNLAVAIPAAQTAVQMLPPQGVPEIGRLTVVIDGVLQCGDNVLDMSKGDMTVSHVEMRITPGSSKPRYGMTYNVNGAMLGGEILCGQTGAANLSNIVGGYVEGLVTDCKVFTARQFIDTAKHTRAANFTATFKSVWPDATRAIYRPSGLRAKGAAALTRVVDNGATASIPQLSLYVEYVLDHSQSVAPTNDDNGEQFYGSYNALRWDGATITRRIRKLRNPTSQQVRQTVNFGTNGSGTVTHALGVTPQIGIFNFAPGTSPNPGDRIVVTQLNTSPTTITLQIVDSSGANRTLGSVTGISVMGLIGLDGG